MITVDTVLIFFTELVIVLFIGFLIGHSRGKKETDSKWIRNSRDTIALKVNGKSYMVYKQK